MDPIRPIGPLERDLEPVVRVTPSSPDGRRSDRDPEAEARPAPRRRPAPVQPPPDDENGTSLIDVRV
jgi:hypothetical protein